MGKRLKTEGFPFDRENFASLWSQQLEFGGLSVLRSLGQWDITERSLGFLLCPRGVRRLSELAGLPVNQSRMEPQKQCSRVTKISQPSQEVLQSHYSHCTDEETGASPPPHTHTKRTVRNHIVTHHRTGTNNEVRLPSIPDN